MKRLRRWAFNGVAGLSLLLLAATLAGWGRSMFICDHFSLQYVNHETRRFANIGASWNHGGVYLIYLLARVRPDSEQLPRPLLHGGAAHWTSAVSANPSQWSYREISQSGYVLQPHVWVIEAPFWSLAIACAVAPSLWLCRWRSRHSVQRRLSKGQCVKCGYDLRATPDRCPECGAVPEKLKVESDSLSTIPITCLWR
jgi:hypothetical protein